MRAGVQKHRFGPQPRRRPVAGHRMAEVGHMDADLMRAARSQPDFEKRKSREPLQHAIFGQRRAARRRSPRGHARPADRVARDGLGDAPRIRANRALDQRQVESFPPFCAANCAARFRCAASLRATSSTPLVSLSSRCTIPGRRAAAHLRQRLKVVHQAIHQRARSAPRRRRGPSIPPACRSQSRPGPDRESRWEGSPARHAAAQEPRE